jgi:hypothetical protein
LPAARARSDHERLLRRFPRFDFARASVAP